MLRSFTFIVFLFLLSSCATHDVPITSGNVIPEQAITSKTAEVLVPDENKFNIALLAPISKQKDILNAAQIAIDSANNPEVNLFMLDSDLISQDPNLLLAKLLEQKIKVIVGPLYAPETEKLEVLLRDKDITILSLSNDSSISGKSLLMLGISPDLQAKIITNYAISQGVKHFYLLLPATKYGKMIDATVTDIVTSKDNATHTVTWYSDENFDQVMDEFVKSIVTNYKSEKDKVIFMPQGGSSLTKLNRALELNQLQIGLLGSQAWDHPMTERFPMFNGAMLLRKNLSDKKFSAEFNKLFHTKSSNIDIIAYNSIMMLANMQKDKLLINKETIISNNQVVDKYSAISFTPDGQSLYKIPVVELRDGSLRVVEND